MEELKMPELLTPELIESIADNADAIKSVLSSQNSSSNGNSDDNSNRVTKIRFILCNVVIINRNE